VADAGSVVLRRLADVDIALQHNTRRNLELAIATLDGRVLRPGESLSFWRCVGNPHRAHGLSARPGAGPWPPPARGRGWRSLPALESAALARPGATVFYNYLDLRLRNGGPEAYRLRLWLTEDELRGEMRSDRPPALTYEVVEEDHRFRRRGTDVVRENRLYRATRDRRTGAPVGRELLAHNVFPVLYQPGPEVTIEEES